MRARAVALASTSLFAFALIAPAGAQTASGPATAGQQGAAAPDPQNAPAGGTPAAAQDAAGTDAQAASDQAATQGGEVSGSEIVVTGIKKSLQSAEAIKRNSVQQIDSVVAEDIGKLPDVAVSDTAARIPGVQVERSGGEASRVLVRGLPDFNTTYNGRDIFTAEARSVALQDFPASGIAALEVFKTTTADLIEGGLAGEVNVRSRKPFDFDGFQVAGAVWGQYEKRSGHYDPNGNLLITDRWDTSIGEIGALVNFSRTRLRYLDSTRSNTDYIANIFLDGDGHQVGADAPGATHYRIPDIQRIDYGVGDRTRPSVNGALQWRPTPDLEFYGEALWQGFRNKVSDRELETPLWGGSTYSNIVADGSADIQNIQSVTVTGQPFDARPDGFQGATFGKTDTYQYAVGAKYGSGAFKLSTDVARTASTFTNSIYSMDFIYATNQTISANTGLTGLKDGPAFSYAGNFDPDDPNNYRYRGFFDRRQQAHGADWQWRVDASYDTGSDLLKKIETGFRYVDRDSSYTEGSRYDDERAHPAPFDTVPVDYTTFTSGFPGNDPEGIRGYLVPSYKSLRDNIDDIRTFAKMAAGDPPFDPNLTYSAKEKSYAGYAQIQYKVGSESGLYVDGAVGIRVVNTKLDILGISPDTNLLTDYAQHYTDWLPNASARVHFTNKLQLRLSYTQTRTRPSFGQYNPGTYLNPQQTGGSPAGGNRGNPELRPFNSDNYDASLEYYYSRTGFVSGAVFQRDITGFIQDANVLTGPLPGFPNGTNISQPFNTGKGRIRGAEVSGTAFLDTLGAPAWLSAFGVAANATYLDTREVLGTRIGGAFAGPLAGTTQPITGVSKWSYNVDGIYEHGGLSLRLSYNHRSSWDGIIPQLRDQTPNPDGPLTGYSIYNERTKGVGRLDFSGSYDVFKNLTLTADWTNMLAKPYRTTLTYEYFPNLTSAGTDSFPRAIRYEESVFSLGARFRF